MWQRQTDFFLQKQEGQYFKYGHKIGFQCDCKISKRGFHTTLKYRSAPPPNITMMLHSAVVHHNACQYINECLHVSVSRPICGKRSLLAYRLNVHLESECYCLAALWWLMEIIIRISLDDNNEISCSLYFIQIYFSHQVTPQTN